MNLKPYLLALLTTAAFAQKVQKKTQADLIVTNAKIYTVNKDFEVTQALAVKDGKILEVGTNSVILKSFTSPKIINATGKYIYPGFYDAHAHFHSYGLNLQRVDLRGTKSFDEVIAKIVAFQKEHNLDYIHGRGWDQNDWVVKEFPNKEQLDKLFPNTPVAITRIDGHCLVSQFQSLTNGGNYSENENRRRRNRTEKRPTDGNPESTIRWNWSTTVFRNLPRKSKSKRCKMPKK